MTSLETYRLYLGINNHFFKPSYDYFRYGPVPVKPETFENKPVPEKYRYERLSKKFQDKETLENFLVANIIGSTKKVWVGDLFGSEADTKYKEWIGRLQSCGYTMTGSIKQLVENHGGSFNDLFTIAEIGQHPEIVKAQLRNAITLEHFVLLDMCVNFFPKLDRELEDDRTWLLLRNKSTKYRPFINRINISISKLKKNLLKVLKEMGVSN